VGIAVDEVQRVVGGGKRRKPVFSIHQFAPGGELGKKILIHPFSVLDADVWHRLAGVFHDLEILAVYPNPSLKIAFALLHLLRCHVEGIAMEFVQPLLADVGQVVLWQFVGSNGEGVSRLEIEQVFFRHGQTGLRRKDNGLGPLCFFVVAHVGDLLVFAGDLAFGIDGVRFNVLPERVAAADGLHFRFFGRKSLDDLRGGDFFRRGWVEGPLSPVLG